MAHEATIAAMKAWCVENYENGADTMVECWCDSDYEDMIKRAPDVAAAWDTLKSVASIYADRQANARNEAF